MKILLKLGLSLAAVAAIALLFVTMNSEPAAAGTPICPILHCPSNLSGYNYLGPCASDIPGRSCLGWRYQLGSNPICHVPALGGL